MVITAGATETATNLSQSCPVNRAIKPMVQPASQVFGLLGSRLTSAAGLGKPGPAKIGWTLGGSSPPRWAGPVCKGTKPLRALCEGTALRSRQGETLWEPPSTVNADGELTHLLLVLVSRRYGIDPPGYCSAILSVAKLTNGFVSRSNCRGRSPGLRRAGG